MEPHRRLVCEGPLAERNSRVPERCWWFLFNDLVLYAERLPDDALKFRGLVMLAGLRLENLSESPCTDNGVFLGWLLLLRCVGAVGMCVSIAWYVCRYSLLKLSVYSDALFVPSGGSGQDRLSSLR